MDDSRGMRDRERIGDLLGELDRALQRQAGPGNDLVERTAAHELHDEEVDPVGVIHFVDRDDVRVVERRCGPRLPEKAVAAIAIASRVSGNHLDGHNAAQTRVGRPIDDTHAALADAVFDLVVREGCPDHGPHLLSSAPIGRRRFFLWTSRTSRAVFITSWRRGPQCRTYCAHSAGVKKSMAVTTSETTCSKPRGRAARRA